MRNIKIKIDVEKQNYIKLDCMQNDDIEITITLLENGVAYPVKYNVITLNWIKSDNTFVVISGSSIAINNNIVTIKLLRDCTRAIGESKFELEITDNNSKQLSTFPLCINVVGSVLGNGEASKNVLTVVEELKEMIEMAKKQDNEEYTITTANWGAIDPKTLEYTYILTHTLNSKKLHITTYENNKGVKLDYETLDNSRMKFTSDSNANVSVILSSGYYGGYTSGKVQADITNIYNQLENLDCGTW